MSVYRCVFCGGKFDIDDFDDLHHKPTEKELIESETHIEGSSYEWWVCNYCNKERKKMRKDHE